MLDNLTEQNIEILKNVVDKISLSFVGAILALILKHFYDKLQRKKELKRVKKSLIDIIENVVLTTLMDIDVQYSSINDNFKTVTEIKLSKFLMRENYLSSKILNFFNQKDLMELFLSKKIDISELYAPIHNLDIYKEVNPLKVERNYTTELNELIITYKNKLGVTEKELRSDAEFMEEANYNFDYFKLELDIEKQNNLKNIKHFESLLKKLK